MMRREVLGIRMFLFHSVWLLLTNLLVIGALGSQIVSAAAVTPSSLERMIIARFKPTSAVATALSQSNATAAVALSMPINGLELTRNVRFETAPVAFKSTSNSPSSKKQLEISVFRITDPSLTITQAIKALKASGQVLYAEPDYPLSINAIPDDSSFSSLYGLHNTGQSGGTDDADIDAPEAWDITTGATSVVVAVIDTGVQYDHPDLVDNMWVNPGEIAGDGLDNDGNGYIDDVHGINCIDDGNSANDGDPNDDNSHGTHVAGTLGAQGNNGIGITGVAQEVSIMALKYLNSSGNGVTSDAVTCLAYIHNMKTMHGINIKLSNNSWGGGGFSLALFDAIEQTGNDGVLFIAAAGNDGTDNDQLAHFPSSFELDSVIAVAATDSNDNAYAFTNFGESSVDLGAPGVSIFSTVPNDGFANKTGTSMATPHVAGAAALLWANEPGLSIQKVKQLLLDTVDSISALQDITLTGGRLNINNALTCTSGVSSQRMHTLLPADNIIALVGEDMPFMVRLSECGDPILGALVTVTPDNGDALFNLLDDGLGVDTTAGDGVYSGVWNPNAIEIVNFTLAFGVLNDQRSLNALLVPDYAVDDTYPFAWNEINTQTDIGLANVDDQDVEIAIGFDFVFFGQTFSSVFVHSNGMLKFGSSNELSFFNFLNIPNTTAPNNFIAPFWEDLNPAVSNGRIYSSLQGSAPNRRLIIEWHDLLHFLQISDPELTSGVSFQAILYEGSDDIVVQYFDTSFGSPEFDDGAKAMVGIEFLDGSRGIEYANQEGGITADMAVLFSPDTSAKKVLTIDENLTGGVVVDDFGPLLNCPQICYGQYPSNSVVTLTAIAQTGFAFTGWSDPACPGTGDCALMMDNHRTLSASFIVIPAIKVTPATGLVTSESGSDATFDMVLTTQPSDDVTVMLASDNELEGIPALSSVNFTSANWDQAQTVTVNGQNDNVDDGDVAYAIVTGAATSNDADYDGLGANNVALTNLDDDTAGISITPVNALMTSEDGSSMQFTVVLDSQPLENVSIALQSNDLSEATLDKSSLTFTSANGKTPQIVTVTGVDDQIIDGTIAYSIITSASISDDPLYSTINPPDVSANNSDNDSAIVHVNPVTGLITSEIGGSDSFTVRLETFPQDVVTINLSSLALDDEITIAPLVLNFLPGNATSPQIVTVTGVNDDLDDGDIAFQIITSNALSNDLDYANLPVADVVGINLDDDIDSDSDQIIDPLDNCPLIANPAQIDSDLDGLGNACDEDDDNDTVLDLDDNCPSDANLAQKDTDGDQIGDACDHDSDNDGILDGVDLDPLDPAVCHDADDDGCDDCSVGSDGFGPEIDADAQNDGPDNDSDGLCDIGDTDDDNDGVDDITDNCPFTANANQADEDGNGVGNVCDQAFIDERFCFPIVIKPKIGSATLKVATICL